eukprot:CAMPEP_0196573988 /NCGR_PEP_ID=MMETSP1081-20130531/3791_1 /TAXON_ID=36882 /ORGANISM="Pyramimonas amylifera, Strain CCMP720" /LENGTH=468 /DNA_ID=CAMNT_0041891871 /DNA_START=96 /DNA_END=1501 /DNA_ORIENTATION=+
MMMIAKDDTKKKKIEEEIEISLKTDIGDGGVGAVTNVDADVVAVAVVVTAAVEVEAATRDKGSRKSMFDAGPVAALADPQEQAKKLQQQQLLAQQWILQQQMQSMAQVNAASGTKKQREVYVGNLTVGLVTPPMLTELFNGALQPCSPNGPPVVSVSMNPDGKFCFVELRTEELSNLAMNLDKVELCGRTINVGRPRGYVDPSLNPSPAGAALPSPFPNMPNMPGMLGAQSGLAGLGVFSQFGAAANPLLGMGGPSAPPASCCLFLENLASLSELQDPQERLEVAQDVKEECNKFGQVVDIYVPTPTPEAIQGNEPGRIYVRFIEQAGAIAAQRALNNRTFSGNKVMATFVPEGEFERAKLGVWLPAPPKPVPAEGVVKMRGLPFSASKQDIVVFFQGFGLVEENVRVVHGRDGRPTGEAYAIFEGAGADVRGALAKHRMMLGSRYVELFPSSKEELNQVFLAGSMAF